MAGFSGGWLSKQFYVDPPEPLHQIDPSHTIPEAADPTLGAWQGPAILNTDPAPYIVGESVPFVVDTGGMVYGDEGEWGDHYDGYGGPNFREWDQLPSDAAPVADVMQGAAWAAAHGEDQGAALRHVYDPGPLIDNTDTYWANRVEGFGPIELPALAGGGQRGLNSYAVNNPPLEMYGGQGFRYGITEQFNAFRRMYDPTRVNDERLVQVNTMDTASDQVETADPGPYNSPFDEFARAITTVTQRPMMRRVPAAIDQSIMSDGEDELYAADTEWVIG